MSENLPSNYRLKLESLHHAFGVPNVSGDLKLKPEDFRVTEIMEHEPCGEGEHYWVDATKVNLSTDKVAKALARFSGVANRDVGFAGMKDVNAVTRQWFSVWAPKNQQLDWSSFGFDGVQVHSVTKHTRKIKRGAHARNRFNISIKNLSGEVSQLAERMTKVSQFGLPNYFGSQRFGWDAANLTKAQAMFEGSFKVRDKVLKGMLLSAARSFLFNLVVSARIEEQTWLKLHASEPANLNGGNAIFTSEGETDNNQRLDSLDIHPTAPMWGRGGDKASEKYRELADWEARILVEYQDLQRGLESRGLDYQRRSIRSVPYDLQYQVDENQLQLSFELQVGQFATSVLREIVNLKVN